ncbi:GNAT family N-acetyltransferase [Arthrobacter sp. SO5]|uniref:GNAT family N-acetyltransferase n=1 Tax=Arthrobacter sp. SO5 TaxID=1897055 RepID=UPI0035AC1A62
MAAFVIDGEQPTIVGENHERALLLACAVVTLEDRLPGPGFPRGTSGSMSSVFVAPEHRGRGLARAVVSAGLSWLDEMSAEVVDLHATPDPERLYRSLGFSEARSLALRRVNHP